MKRRGMSILALLLSCSMALSPVSYVRASSSSVLEESETTAEEETIPEETKAPEQKPEEETGTEPETKESETVETVPETESSVETEAGETDPEETKTETDAETETAEEPTEAEAETVQPTASVRKEEVKKIQKTAADAAETIEEIALFAARETGLAVAPTMAITGVNVLKSNPESEDGYSEYGMFPITDAVCTVKGDQIEITFHTGRKKVFDGIYLGLKSDEGKTVQYSGSGSPVTFTIQVPLSKKNTWIPVTLYRSDKGTWNDNELWLSIPDVTALTKQPEAASKKSGETVSLSVAAAGTASYQWQKSSDNGATWTDCQGANVAVYEFTVSAETAGLYRCKVTAEGKIGTVSESVQVSVASEQEGYISDDGVSAVYASDDTKKPGQVYSMFKIGASRVTVKGDCLEVSIWVKPASSGKFSYDAIYIGDRNDETKEPVVLGAEDPTMSDKLQKFTFTVPVSMAGGEVHFVPRSASKGTWSVTSSLAFKLPKLSDFKKPSVINITTQPKDVTVKAGKPVTLSVEAAGEAGVTLSYQWQKNNGTDWVNCDGDGAQTASYGFTMSEAMAGSYRCRITDSTGTTVTTNSVSAVIATAPAVTGTAVCVVKNNGAVFTMFKIADSRVVEDGDELEITITTKNTSFDELYLGENDEENKTPVIRGTELTDGGWSFTFRVPKSQKGAVLPVALHKVKDGSWYTNQDLWIYIPDEGIETIPTAENEIRLTEGGTGTASKKLNIQSSKAVLKGDSVIVTLNVTGKEYDRLYLGVQADSNKTPVISGSYSAETGLTTFTFTVPAEKQGMNIPVTPGNANSWFTYARDLFISIPNLAGNANTSADGIYDLYGSAYPASNTYSLNFERESSLTIKGDTATVTMVTQAGNYDKLYIGEVSDPDSEKNAKAAEAVDRSDIASGYKSFTFTIPTADLGKDLNYVVHLAKSGTWAVKAGTLHINGILPKTGDLPDPVDPNPVDPNPGVNVPADGIYTMDVTSSAAMFRVVNCVLTVKDGKMSAVLTLSGTGYGYLYMGTKEEAAAAAASRWIPFVTDADGKYTYTVPVEALDKGISVAAYSTKNKIWYDRILTFNSDTLKKIGDVDNTKPADPSNPTKPPEPGNNGTDNGNNTIPDNDGKEDHESKYESDTSGSTAKVDSATGLADGVYKPDKFSWSGGTGKVRISCNKITVKNGQAYATLVFSSSSYQYVKASGNTYYTTKSGGSAMVTIPIALNKNNKIIGMTTKMSAAHEIEYSIFVYLAMDGARSIGENSNKKLDEEAPEIIGLEYQSETKLDYAEYFKIYHYDQGIVLLEIDTTKDTARDPEKQESEDSESTADNKADQTESKKTDAAEETEDSSGQAADSNIVDGEELVPSEAEKAAELYKGNVVKYLLIPAGVEVPVGLEDDMILVQMPEKDEDADGTSDTKKDDTKNKESASEKKSDEEEWITERKAYVADETLLETMKELGLLDMVAAVGMEKEECQVPEIVQKMEAEQGEKTAEIVYGGLFDMPDFKTLIKQEVNLALMPAELLPREEKTGTENADRTKTEAKAVAGTKTDKAAADETEETDEPLSVEAQTKLYEDLTEKFAMFDIPVIVDRSADEKTELAKYEWIKVYGVLFGCEEKTDELFQDAVKEAKQQESRS